MPRHYLLQLLRPWCGAISLFLAFCGSCPAWADGRTVFDRVPDAEEYTALMRLFNATDGPGWANGSNWGTGSKAADFATWAGVTVSNGDVVGLDLSDNNLIGTLPTELALLGELRKFAAPNNQLSGPLPDLRAIGRLGLLDLGSNQLSGALTEIAFRVPQSVNYLNLSSNGLSQNLPYGLVRFGSLEYLNLSDNQLTGEFSNDFFAKKTLNTGLWRDYLDKFTDWGIVSKDQQEFLLNDISNNTITSSLWVSAVWTAWERGLLDEDALRQLVAQLTDQKLQGLQRLTYLNLSHNQFSGNIPHLLPEAVELKYLNLNLNQF